MNVTNIQYLQECINLEMKIGTISANNLFSTVALGDFNTKSNDIK